MGHRIKRVRCFAVDIAMVRPHVMSHDRRHDSVGSTIVEVTDGEGRRGYGESSPMDGSYIDGFPESVRVGVAKLAPALEGLDIVGASALCARMDATLVGQHAAKAAVDSALWDLRGQILEQPVAELLGGRRVDRLPTIEFLSYGSDPDELIEDVQRGVEAGYRHWQFKVGNDPADDRARLDAVLTLLGQHGRHVVSLDANRGWPMADVTRFLRLLGDVDVYIEQPCQSLEELAQVRHRTSFPIIADESVRSIEDLVRCFTLGSADALSLKPARLGGPTRTAMITDVAVALGFKVLIDDTLGGGLVDVALAHLGARVPPSHFLAVTQFTDHRVRREEQPWIVGDFIEREAASVYAPTGPGWGVEIDPGALPAPLFEWRARG